MGVKVEKMEIILNWRIINFRSISLTTWVKKMEFGKCGMIMVNCQL